RTPIIPRPITRQRRLARPLCASRGKHRRLRANRGKHRLHPPRSREIRRVQNPRRVISDLESKRWGQEDGKRKRGALHEFARRGRGSLESRIWGEEGEGFSKFMQFVSNWVGYARNSTSFSPCSKRFTAAGHSGASHASN